MNVDFKKSKKFIYGHKHPNEVSVCVDIDWWAVWENKIRAFPRDETTLGFWGFVGIPLSLRKWLNPFMMAHECLALSGAGAKKKKPWKVKQINQTFGFGSVLVHWHAADAESVCCLAVSGSLTGCLWGSSATARRSWRRSYDSQIRKPQKCRHHCSVCNSPPTW